ncbi:MAG: hypothetical protein ACKPKO_57490 [Candidatus Fonsibacter sp.]
MISLSICCFCVSICIYICCKGYSGTPRNSQTTANTNRYTKTKY